MVEIGNGGRIVNNSSVHSYTGSWTAKIPHYAATKAAINNITQDRG